MMTPTPREEMTLMMMMQLITTTRRDHEKPRQLQRLLEANSKYC